MADLVPAQELQAILTVFSRFTTVNYNLASCLSLLLFDLMLSFGNEVDLIWRKKWSFVKFLYLFARYYGILFLTVKLIVETRIGLPGNLKPEPGLGSCYAYSWYHSIGGPIFFTTTINVIFILRIYALYGGNIKVLIALCLMVLAEFACELYVTVATSLQMRVVALPLGLPWPGCSVTNTGSIILLAWIPCTTIAVIFFILTMLKSVNRFYPRRKRSGVSPFRVFSPIRRTVVTDGTVFFFIIFATTLATMLLIRLSNSPYAGLGIPWFIAIYSFSGSKLILNLRIAANSTTTAPISEMLFPFETSVQPSCEIRFDRESSSTLVHFTSGTNSKGRVSRGIEIEMEEVRYVSD